MEIRDLQVFLAVSARLNFTRAAEDVHLSQPSVSVRIRQLEAELGVKLFEQLGKRVALTEGGNCSNRTRAALSLPWMTPDMRWMNYKDWNAVH